MRAALFIGIQASGKSSFFERVMAPLGYEHVSMDILVERAREILLDIEDCPEKTQVLTFLERLTGEEGFGLNE